MTTRTQTRGRVVVVGGANTDIVGHAYRPLVARDSNPGYVRLSSGGVGRNIAENLARLGHEVELVTALGGDGNAEYLASRCEAAGVRLTYALVAPELPGSLYLAILDDGGDMELALNDMRPLDRLTPPALAERAAAFEGADIVVIDANLAADSLEWIAANVSAPLLLDPVSAAKAPRARSITASLAALKCNALEAVELLGGGEPRSSAQLDYTAERLLTLGPERVFVTAGPRGVHYAGPDGNGCVQAPRVGVANATGAGDAFTAGVAAGLLERRSTRECAIYGTTMAGLALASEHTVSDKVSRDALRLALKEVRA